MVLQEKSFPPFLGKLYKGRFSAAARGTIGAGESMAGGIPGTPTYLVASGLCLLAASRSHLAVVTRLTVPGCCPCALEQGADCPWLRTTRLKDLLA